MRRIEILLAALLIAPSAASAKEKKPALKLRATPRVAEVPASILFTAELKNVPDAEAYHCLTLEWTWEEGTTSTHDADCPAFEPGKTEVQRLFTERHTYGGEGAKKVRLVIRKGKHVIARASVEVQAVEPTLRVRQRGN